MATATALMMAAAPPVSVWAMIWMSVAAAPRGLRVVYTFFLMPFGGMAPMGTNGAMANGGGMGMPINSTGALVISVVTVAIALALQSNIVAALIPRMVGAGLAPTVYGFGPTLYSAGILSMLFGITIYLGAQALRQEAQFSVLIMMVITILIAASLAATIQTFSNSAIEAATGPCTAAFKTGGTCTAPAAAAFASSNDGAGAYFGSFHATNTAGSVFAGTGGLAAANQVGNNLALTKTISGFYEVGYALSLLSAIAALVNVGLGGAIGRSAGRIRGM